MKRSSSITLVALGVCAVAMIPGASLSKNDDNKVTSIEDDVLVKKDKGNFDEIAIRTIIINDKIDLAMNNFSKSNIYKRQGFGYTKKQIEDFLKIFGHGSFEPIDVAFNPSQSI